uniref:Uncharacterized protein n=1 Tax=Bartonella rochalimae ATCC BAA-1498 TaxID=685782 RepID=E6YMH4_9HYPH|nr:hypothetical protein BARRO_50425 [Bartonella rochalimae ATCC BAA-1498]
MLGTKESFENNYLLFVEFMALLNYNNKSRSIKNARSFERKDY